MQKNCAIIGAGVAGLATAIRLAQKGYKVDVFEANDFVGGKLSEFQQEGFRFDAGPSLFTMPEFIEELFAITNKNIKDYFQYSRLETICHYFYEDGTRLNAYADKEKFAQEIQEKTGEPKENVLNFLEKSAKKYEVTANLFLKKSLHKVSTWLNSDALNGYWNIRALEVFKTMNQANQEAFKDPRVVQLFNRFATYNGSDPYQTPATLNIIPHLEHSIGAFLPKNGMYAITKALYRLASDLGVEFHLGTKVKKIVWKAKKVEGIEIESGFLPFDVVVSNMDMVGTYRQLLADFPAPEKLLNQPKSSSALIFYWGIKKSFEELDVHNIFFSKDYQKEFACIFKEKTISQDPTIYINITSKKCPEDAPKGCENWFVMINTPNNSNQDWDRLINEARENIINKINKTLKTDLKNLIACEHTLDARTIESRTSSHLGALYGNSSNNKYAAFLRHANFSSQLKNLYFCGGSVHPGGGIPLCLSSAKIVAEML